MTIQTTNTPPELQVELLFERTMALSQGSDEIDTIHVLAALAEGTASEPFADLLRQHGLRSGGLLKAAHTTYPPGSCVNPVKTAAYKVMERKITQYSLDFNEESLGVEGVAEFVMDSGSEWVDLAIQVLGVVVEDLRESLHRYAAH